MESVELAITWVYTNNDEFNYSPDKILHSEQSGVIPSVTLYEEKWNEHKAPIDRCFAHWSEYAKLLGFTEPIRRQVTIHVDLPENREQEIRLLFMPLRAPSVTMAYYAKFTTKYD